MKYNNFWYTLLGLHTTDSSKVAAEVTVKGDSPWFDGHFPDDPILPGIAQLYIVADLITTTSGKGILMGNVSRVKFRKIVRPDELLDISATKSNKKDHYAFRITSDKEEVCSGMMRFHENSDYRKKIKTL